jgi:hypothetical protein
MALPPAVWAVPLGVMAGSVVGLFLTHWIALVSGVLGKRPDAASTGAVANRTLAIVFAMLHPVPWLMFVVLPIGLWLAANDPPSDPWLWFFGAAALWLVGLFAFAFVAARRAQASAARSVP